MQALSAESIGSAQAEQSSARHGGVGASHTHRKHLTVVQRATYTLNKQSTEKYLLSYTLEQ